jgi:UDP-N-acetylmuramoyl-tripeptide--D-alanyl-D-alanine ligase
VQPDIGIITGANEAHLERMGNLQTTARSLLELQEYLGEKPLYLNVENQLLKDSAKPGYIPYGNLMCSGWVAEVAESNLEYIDVVFRKGERRLRAKSHLIGDHVIPTLLLAVVIAETFRLTDAEIIHGLEMTKPFAHRLAPRDQAGVLWIDDSYNGNPDGVRAAISLLKKAVGRRRFFVTPGLVESGKSAEKVHREIGTQLAEAGIEHTVLITNSVTPFIKRGLADGNYTGKIHEYDDALEAFRMIPRTTVAGDVVLVQNDWPDQYA